MRRRLPWFRVWVRLRESPKFVALSQVRRGWLFSCWLAGYANTGDRGLLPGLRTMALELGCQSHLGRAKRILDGLVVDGWLDQSVMDGEVRYRVHDLHDWQRQKDISGSVRCPSHSGLQSDRLADYSKTKSLKKSNVAGSYGQAITEGLENTLPYGNVRPSKPASLFELEEFESGINEQSGVTSEQSGDKRKRKAKVRPGERPDGRRILRDEMPMLWGRYRTTEFGLRSTWDKSDWVAFEAMLSRTADDAEITLTALRRAWVKFCASRDRFHVGQGHPVRWWANNVGAFLGSNGDGGSTGGYSRDTVGADDASDDMPADLRAHLIAIHSKVGD